MLTYQEAAELVDQLLPEAMVERSIGELLAAHPDLELVNAAGLRIVERVLGYVQQIDPARYPPATPPQLTLGLVAEIIARAEARLPTGGPATPVQAAA